MAPTLSLKTLSLAFTLLTSNSLVNAAPWIVTEAYEEIVATLPAYYDHSIQTRIQEITPTVTSLPEALSTATVVTSDYPYAYASNDITIIQELYPTGVGRPAEDDYYEEEYGNANPSYRYYSHGADNHVTVYKVNLTYTAPTGCSTDWTRTTAASVFPPQQVEDLLPRTAVETSLSVDSSLPFQPVTHTYDVVFVDPTQVPSSSLSELRYSHRPTAMYTGSASCDYYDGNDRYTYSDPYDYDENDNWYTDSYWMGISPLALTLIILFGWIGLLLILGFIEAFVRFRRLMTGWQTRRGLPVFWAFTVMPITFIILCFFFKKGYRARSNADAEILRRRWKAMSVWTKLRLFFVWGFRYKYPPMLGPAPALVKASKRPQDNPGPRLLTPSDQGSIAEGLREGSQPRDVPSASGGADPEMAQVQPQSQSQVESLPHVEAGPSLSPRDDEVGRAH